MTRHRSPQTVPFAVPVGAPRGGRGRHRSPARSALRRGALTAGVAGGALAVAGVAVPMLSPAPSTPEPAGTLALSARTTGDAPTPAVTPAAGRAEPVGAASSDLIKAVDRERRAETARAEAARAESDRVAADRAAAAERERARSLDCGVDDTYGGVADSVQTVANALECVYPGHEVGGVGARENASDHPDGYAIDFMTDSGAGSGDAIAECVMDHQDALGVSYAIWNQRINTGSGWEAMEDRGGRTANHEDHVHISFEHGATPDVSVLRGCGGAGGAGKA